MKFGVIIFPGSNCDHDAYWTIQQVAKQPVSFLWHESHNLESCDAVIVPGGFAYGDYVRTGAIEQAKQTLSLVPEAKRNDAAVAAARAALEVAEQAKSVGPISELEQKVAVNPLDHQGRFDLAVALNSKGRRAEAVDHLLEIVKRDRKWNDDGARKQLVQFFEAWGPTDEATVNGRKRLSSILFS